MQPDPQADRGRWWAVYVAPSAAGLEGFFWRVAWFLLILRLFKII